MITIETDLSVGEKLGKCQAMDSVDQWRFDLGLTAVEIVEEDWGASWVIGEKQRSLFLNLFFPEMMETEDDRKNVRETRLMLVEAGEELVWHKFPEEVNSWKLMIRKVKMEEGVEKEQGGKEMPGWSVLAEVQTES